MKLMQGVASKLLTLQLHSWLPISHFSAAAQRAFLATGVSGAAAEWDSLVSWLKTALKSSFFANRTGWPHGLWLAALCNRSRGHTQQGQSSHSNYATVLPWLILPVTPHLMYLSLDFIVLVLPCHSCSINIKLACIRAGWAAGHAEAAITAELCGHTTAAVCSLHLCSLSFLALPIFPHAFSALNTHYSWLWCLGRWLCQVRRLLFLIWIYVKIKSRYK